LAARAGTTPLRRPGTADEVAAVVAFLLSDDAAWITGQNIVIDGGVTLGGGVE
jgi:3-oxoacyl-[acyl-carrier protein] reductase